MKVAKNNVTVAAKTIQIAFPNIAETPCGALLLTWFLIITKTAKSIAIANNETRNARKQMNEANRYPI